MKVFSAKYVWDAVLNSYSQIFFSLNKIFAFIILLVTFFSPSLGIAGLAAVVLTNLFAFIFGFNREEIRTGIFGFNALLLGVALGYQFSMNAAFVFVFILAVFILLILTAVIKGLLDRHALPFLGFPFLVTYWIVSLSSGNFSFLHLSEDNIFMANELAKSSHNGFYLLVHSLDELNLPLICLVYFKTLSATFFISSVLGGMLIAAGLLYFSRIAFSLSIIGFAAAYYSYRLLGADVNDLTYHLVGSNYIFFAIGIGCFYLIPNAWSYSSAILLTPVLMMLLIALGKTLAIFQLKTFTLSFSILTTMFLFALHNRWFHQFLHLVTIQYYSAEKTIYKYLTSLHRFRQAHLAKIALPFFGEWKVSQGYGGTITHLGDWSRALDFVIEDDEDKTYRDPGTTREDFYCYNKPVVAPLEGYVYNIQNNVEENEIAAVNTEKNWGNTIIINHLNGLYSQISHLKKDSFKVSIGDYVTKGTVLAACGNSGRSPEPHIHFQLQLSPVIGAKTIEYPVTYFLERENETERLHYYEVPSEGMTVSNVQVSGLLLKCFDLYPGKKFNFRNDEDNSLTDWEVRTDSWNRLYIFCNKTHSYAYFVNDGTMFYFTDFEGDEKSLLFHLYLSCYRILLGCYPTIKITDTVPLIHFNNRWILWIQDIFAPFHLFTKAEFKSMVVFADNNHSPANILLQSNIRAGFMNRDFRSTTYQVSLREDRINQIIIQNKNKKQTYTCVS